LAVAQLPLRFQIWPEDTAYAGSQRPWRLREVDRECIEHVGRRNGQGAAEDMEEREKEQKDHMTKVNIG
jgi:hypothetical protein